jgi:hypothetical protein
VEKLNEIATAKLSEIVRRSTAGEVGWEGYDKAELIAAKECMYISSQLITAPFPEYETSYSYINV